MAESNVEGRSLNFLEEIVEEDLETGKYKTILTRFPPEPNGYLHIGHAKSICLNFGLALKYGGKTNLRFDDTNPAKEETEYVESIIEDVKWLGFNPDKIVYASDYFEQLYQFAVKLIEKGLAYVDDSTSEEIALQKGTPIEPGIANKYRSRTMDENLRLFKEMREGVYQDGEKVLRAQKSTWLHLICICVIQLSTGLKKHIITEQEMTGVFIRCMILRTVKVIQSKKSLIPFARWNLYLTGHYTTGLLKNWKYFHHVNMNLHDSISLSR